MHNWLSLNQNNIESSNKPIQESVDDIKLNFEKYYYDTLLENRMKEIEEYKNMIINHYPTNELTESIMFDSKISNYTNDMMRYYNRIGLDIRKYFLTYNKDVDYQLSMIKKIPSIPMISQLVVISKVSLYYNFKKLPFSKNFPEVFLNGLDLTDENKWIHPREVIYKVFTKQFPKWLMLSSSSMNRMKEEIYETSILAIRPMTYNMKSVYTKLESYMRTLKKEFKDFDKQFKEITRSFKIMEKEIQSTRKSALSKVSTDKGKKYIKKVEVAYKMGFQLVMDVLSKYHRAMMDVFIDQFQNAKNLINTIYSSLEYRDKNELANMENQFNDHIYYNQKDFMKGMIL